MRILVYNKATGEERVMGEQQFERVKKNGWKVKPETSGKQKANTETAKDSGDGEKSVEGSTSDPIAEILKGNVSEVVAKIKALAEEGDLDTIKAIGEANASSAEPRSTIADAVSKY